MTENRTILLGWVFKIWIGRKMDQRLVTGCPWWVRGLAILLAVVGAWPIAAQDALHATAPGRYRLGWSCAAPTPTVPRMAVCVVHVEDPTGQPVAGLNIAVAARPLLPRHGAPLRPHVTTYLGQGNYRVEGLGPSFNGRWVLGFRLERNAEIDSVAFEIEWP